MMNDKNFRIPQISKDTLESFNEYYGNLELGELSIFMERVRALIIEDNPALANYIDNNSRNFGNPLARAGYNAGVIITYELIRRQIESDNLEKELESD
jgi:hypothetical protein